MVKSAMLAWQSLRWTYLLQTEKTLGAVLQERSAQ